MTHRKELYEYIYWLTNKAWYVFDPSLEFRYRLTDEAPEEARNSFQKWLKMQTDEELQQKFA